MQTFLPYADFVQSAKALDDKRLGKQRVECLQILIANYQRINDPILAYLHDTYGHKSAAPGAKAPYGNHPCTFMWAGFEAALVQYALACCDEWAARGFSNERCLPIFLDLAEWHSIDTLAMPPWLGAPHIHASHRAALLHKAPNYYARYGWYEQPLLAYVWPDTGEGEIYHTETL